MATENSSPTRDSKSLPTHDIRRALDTVALALEADGYEPEEIGAAMVGFAFSLIAQSAGPEHAQFLASTLHDVLVKEWRQ
jgi:hypothetical protein